MPRWIEGTGQAVTGNTAAWIILLALRWSPVVVALGGLGLIGVGVLCLYLSYAVARTGLWSQGTLNAFGVGFVVGGVVDVLAIFALQQFIDAEKRRREVERKRREEE